MTVKSKEEYRNEKVLIDWKPGAATKSMRVSFAGFSMAFEKGAGPFTVPRWSAKRLKKLGFVEVSRREKSSARIFKKEKNEEIEISDIKKEEDDGN